MIKLMFGDCLERMKEIPDGSVDMVMADLPYGTTQNKWDSVIPLEPLWVEYERVCQGMALFTAAQPFCSILTVSNLKAFKYDLIWEKTHPSGHLNAKIAPLRQHESVLVFQLGGRKYFPQMTEKNPDNVRPDTAGKKSQNWGEYEGGGGRRVIPTT